jgi:nucleoside 2-deoxyribosyltransferase
MLARKPRQKLYYLASPYSHSDEDVMLDRYQKAEIAAVELLKRGIHSFAPIPYNHPWKKYSVPGDWPFWEAFDKNFVERCDAVLVLTLDGWDKSVGVAAEIAFANEIGIPVYYITFEEVFQNNLEHLR